MLGIIKPVERTARVVAAVCIMSQSVGPAKLSGLSIPPVTACGHNLATPTRTPCFQINIGSNIQVFHYCSQIFTASINHSPLVIHVVKYIELLPII
jgi:hypothetical protein